MYYTLKQSLNNKIIQNFVAVSGLYFFSIPLLLLANIVLIRTLSVSDLEFLALFCHLHQSLPFWYQVACQC